MMYENILKELKYYINNKVPENYIETIQEIIIQSGHYMKADELIIIVLLSTILLTLITSIFAIDYNINLIAMILFTLICPSLIIGTYFLYKKEKRNNKIEQETPDFLRQLASLINAGLGIETALNEVVKHTKGPLSTEIKRALISIKFGNSFEQSLNDIAKRVDSKNLKRIFMIINKSRDSGGNLTNILEQLSEDLKQSLMLKQERRASVMMSIMFLIIASIIAAPFALGMIQTYSNFIGSNGRINPLADIVPISSIGYIIIHSILVSILIGIVLSGKAKNGIKYIFVIVPSSLLVYFGSNIIFQGLFQF
ncbi:MAG: type II secretion system F family protein [Methanobacteriaceae archaeon]|nr:type II secretion system F family protein [Methanobacteriaceae archaeon]